MIPGPARVAIALVVAVPIAIIVYLQAKPREDAPQAVPSPEQGSACPYLEDAARAYEARDVGEFRRAARKAARVAEDAADRSGVDFGRVERLAMEIGARADEPIPSTSVTRLLESVRKTCEALGRWT